MLFTTIRRYLILLLVFLTPLFFLPVFSNSIDLPKKTIIVVLSGICFILYLAEALWYKKISFRLGNTGFLLLLFMIANLVSIFTNSNPWQSFYQTGVWFISLFLLFIVISHHPEKKLVKHIFVSLIVSISLLSLFNIYQFIGATESLFNSSFFSKTFNPAGSALNLLGLVILVLPLTVILAFKTKDSLFKILLFLLSTLQLISLILTGAQSLLPGSTDPIRLLPLRAGWMIAIDSLKLKTFFGFGPDNFLTAFTLFRPTFLNQSANLWNWRFITSSNLVFHLLSTVGLIGLGLFILIALNLLKKVRTKLSFNTTDNLFVYSGLVLLLALSLLVPFNTILWLLLFIFIGLAEMEKPKPAKSLDFKNQRGVWTVNIIAALFLLLVLSGWYLTAKNVLADAYFKKSQDYSSHNLAKETYDFQLKAIQTNYQNINFHLAFANTNFALANAIASQGEMSDQDQQQISALIQQAIQEAKIATSLNPENVFAWETLTNIYRNLIGVAQGADQWAIAAASQAIALNPTDPNMRLNLGGIYFTLQNWEDAIRSFRTSIELKNDFANGYYNLAAAYQQSGEYAKAYLALQSVQRLVNINSEDYVKVTEEMAALKELVPTATMSSQLAPAQSGQLTEPQTAPAVPSEDRIELPESSGPEVTVVPEPTDTPAVSPTISPFDQP